MYMLKAHVSEFGPGKFRLTVTDECRRVNLSSISHACSISATDQRVMSLNWTSYLIILLRQHLASPWCQHQQPGGILTRQATFL